MFGEQGKVLSEFLKRHCLNGQLFLRGSIVFKGPPLVQGLKLGF